MDTEHMERRLQEAVDLLVEKARVGKKPKPVAGKKEHGGGHGRWVTITRGSSTEKYTDSDGKEKTRNVSDSVRLFLPTSKKGGGYSKKLAKKMRGEKSGGAPAGNPIKGKRPSAYTPKDKKRMVSWLAKKASAVLKKMHTALTGRLKKNSKDKDSKVMKDLVGKAIKKGA